MILGVARRAPNVFNFSSAAELLCCACPRRCRRRGADVQDDLGPRHNFDVPITQAKIALVARLKGDANNCVSSARARGCSGRCRMGLMRRDWRRCRARRERRGRTTWSPVRPGCTPKSGAIGDATALCGQRTRRLGSYPAYLERDHQRLQSASTRRWSDWAEWQLPGRPSAPAGWSRGQAEDPVGGIRQLIRIARCINSPRPLFGRLRRLLRPSGGLGCLSC